jgi:tetratricopeptide (TPR) repeat protein
MAGIVDKALKSNCGSCKSSHKKERRLTMNKNEILNNYRKIVGADSEKAREIIKKLDYKEDYYLLQCIAQTYLDESRFEKDNTMRIYLDKKKWRMAERYIIRAFIVNPDSADVLYTMGGVRKANDQKDVAIYCFKRIIQLGVRKIAFGEYGRGVTFAKELINDSKFELYRLHHEENPGLSRRYLAMYRSGLKKGIPTIYKPLRKFLVNSRGDISKTSISIYDHRESRK